MVCCGIWRRQPRVWYLRYPEHVLEIFIDPLYDHHGMGTAMVSNTHESHPLSTHITATANRSLHANPS